MPSVEQITNFIFGGSVNLISILTIVMCVYAFIMSLVSWRAKVAEIRKDKALTKKDEMIAAQSEEIKNLKAAIGGLSDIVLDAYLSNANVSPDTKKRIAARAEEIKKVADLPIADTTEKLLAKVEEYNPDASILEYKENLKAEAEAAEQILDGVAEAASNAIEKLKV